ncbi:MAG: Ig-like domain-containing protein [bacterium]|nr:Ig-like domain-containing protein [bacterium]
MKKTIIIVFFLLLIFNIGGIVYLNYYNDRPTGEKAVAPVLETASEAPGKKLIIKDKRGLEAFLSVKEVADLDTGLVFSPKTIKIILTQEKQPRLALYTTVKDGEKQQLKSVNGYYDKNEDTYYLKVFLNYQLLEEAKGELTIDTIVSAYLTEALYYIANARVNMEGVEEKAWEIQGEVAKNHLEFFGLTSRQSFRWLESVKGFKIVKPALARYCDGTGRGCWYWEQHLHCSDNSTASCTVQGANCNRYYDTGLKKWVWGGTCVWSKKKCEGLLEKACLANGDYCSAAGCGIDSCGEDPVANCYWVGDIPPEATPTPTSVPGATPTPTPVPQKCSIQGYKLLPGYLPIEPAGSQTVTLGTAPSTTANPYVFSNLDAGNKTVSVTTPAGYTAGYTACTNQPNDLCNKGTPTSGSSWTGNCPAGGRVDLWWYYFPNPSCTGAAPESPTTTAISGIFHAYAYGVQNATVVKFPTWSSYIEVDSWQNDIIWYGAPPYASWVTQNGETWTSEIDLSKHPGVGDINVHVYMDNAVKTNELCGTANFTRLCTLTLTPTTLTLPAGESTLLTAEVIPSEGISKVNFSSSDSNTANVNPGSDNTVSYQTNVTGKKKSIGPVTITAEAIVNPNTILCSGTSTVTVTTPGPWWQVKDSDVVTNGDIISSIYPAGVNFILDGTGGYPGVAVYGGQKNFGSGVVSSKLWLANTTSTWLTQKTYDYNYFRGWLPTGWWDGKTTTPDTIVNPPDYFRNNGTAVDGYKVFYHSGNLIIDAAQNLQDQRAILFVDGGDLTINKNINLTDGTGFFMAIVKGNIIIDPLTTSLEGIYSADNLFKTGTKYNEGLGIVDNQLNVRGSVTGLGGITLQRNLGGANSTTPAEVFEYAPDLIFTYPSKLMVRAMRWKEVAP